MKSIYKIGLLTLITGFIILSCKKEISTPDEPNPPIKERSEAQLLKDSTYFYYKLYSYWEKYIPQYDDIPSFTDPISSVDDVLEKLKSTTPRFRPYLSTGGTYDRFSFFSLLDNNTAIASTNLRMDKNDGYGLYFTFGAIDDSTAYPFVYLVEGGSPANLAGIKRSDMILTLDNTLDMKTVVVCKNDECVPSNLTEYTKIVNALNNLSNKNSISLELKHADNSTNTYNLQYATYEIDPLLSDTIFEYPGNNVGYFAYSSFEQIEHGNKNQVKVDNIFNNFSNKNIKSLIVDLRYNGGGYVDAATYIADKIINSSGKDQLMLSYELNSYLSRNKNAARSSFKDVYFKKNNNLEIETVCFIVSNQTASASEMLINVLKPYMNVKIIAEQTTTYGKPVGFFETKIMGQIGLWVTSFKLLNAHGESEYWTGIPADKSNISDYIFVDFANKEELMIKEALKNLGVSSSSPLARRYNDPSINTKKLKLSTITAPPHKGALKQEL